MVSWCGKNGRVFFYQSEMPYDVSGKDYGEVVGYRVNSLADNHEAKGVGVYSYFRDYDNVCVESAFAHHAVGGKFENAFTVWLNGFSGLKSIINGKGEMTKTPGKPYFLSNYQGEDLPWSTHFWKGLILKAKSLF